MKFIFNLLFASGLNRFYELVTDWLKIELITASVKISEQVRRIFSLVAFVIFAIILAASGFLIVHFALFFYLPGSVETKALILLILGSVYFIVPTSIILWLCSRRGWMKATGLQELVDRFTNEK